MTIILQLGQPQPQFFSKSKTADIISCSHMARWWKFWHW